MNKPIPAYLKLHVEQQAPTATDEAWAELTELCRHFAAATGWTLRPAAVATSNRSPVRLVIEQAATDGGLSSAEDTSSAEQRCPAEAALRLAEGLNRLLEQIYQTETALWKREAELAAGVPVSQRPDEPQHLAERLEAILGGGVQAVGADAAALYMLDDATSELKLRAVYGLPQRKLLDPPRPLRGAIADLEALVGHAVVLEDTSLLPHWKTPENFPSALCVPVSTPSTPLGTLWVFSSERRDFDATQTNVIEIIAGRIASELEREMLIEEGVRARDYARQLTEAGRRQHERLPTFAPIVDDWEFAAWNASGERISGDFYDWGVLFDGRLFFAVGSVAGPRLNASITLAALQAAMKSHQSYPHTTRQMLERLNEGLWTGSVGDQFASLFYALVDPETGELEYAFAGRMTALITSVRGARPLSCPAAFLGVGPETPFMAHHARIQPGEAIAIISDSLLQTRNASGELLTPDAIAETLRRGGPQAAESMVDRARSVILAFDGGTQPLDGSLLVARRLDR